MLLSNPGTLWLVGCGAMGGALLGRWRAAGLPDAAVTVIDPAPKGLPECYEGRLVSAVPSEIPDIVILGVKPQVLATAATSLPQNSVLLVSMLAGVSVATLRSILPHARIARIMPNLAVRIGQGVTGVYAPELDAHDLDTVRSLLEPTGTVVWLDHEGDFDALTAVSGSGPAYLFRFIEALSDAAQAMGLNPSLASTLALHTVTGAASLAAKSGEPPSVLRQAVTSPNGTTQAGLEVLDGTGSLSALMRDAVRAAAERSRGLAEETVKSASVGKA